METLTGRLSPLASDGILIRLQGVTPAPLHRDLCSAPGFTFTVAVLPAPEAIPSTRMIAIASVVMTSVAIRGAATGVTWLRTEASGSASASAWDPRRG